MASYGDALAALDDFRASLVHRRQTSPAPGAEARAFRASRALTVGAPFRGVHATGVGLMSGRDGANPADFAIKVYVFNPADVAEAVQSDLMGKPYQGVEVDVEVLPIQVAFAPAATPSGNPQARIRPVVGGVEIGPIGGEYVGTLGCFVRRGTGTDAPLFVLSNNHVLADVNRLSPGAEFTQPYSSSESDVIATLADFEPIRFPAPGSQPRNTIDAAIATVTDPSQVSTGQILGIDKYTPELLAPRPGMKVTKSGRTTGVTTGVVRAVRVRGVQINYGESQAPLIATFDNTITIVGDAGQSFSNPGDSGSVILDRATGQPVALLFAGDSATTTACDLAAACSRFGVHPV